MRSVICGVLCCVGLLAPLICRADENLLGYVAGAEVIPRGGWELYNITTLRRDKDVGYYQAFDNEIELEYGVSDRFNVFGAVQLLSVDTHGLSIDGYLPGGESVGPKLSGVELGGKYNFLRPAADNYGLSLRFGLDYSWLDHHSGEDKDTASFEVDLIGQKYFLDGQLVWVTNVGLETTYADRAPIDDLPEGFDWPTDPEMEIELKGGMGLSYRFVPNWYAGAEAIYETEFETEVGQERWSVFAGPSLHYGSAKWWATLTYFPQIKGGGEVFIDQTADLHLVEKTKQEVRLKIGINF
ncbi:MAG TPA: DUF6662 family protein [Thermoanaerobaculia bacterium]|jgi:hypothetical protein|nr:DUF6662 family protein [Thermoanaerobaculia bacterium]